MIQNPNISNKQFDNRSFNIIKNRIKSDIESLKENATKYAFRRSLVNMNSESPSSYYMVGYMDDLEDITPMSLWNTYNSMINNYVCDIFVIGSLDMDLVNKKFREIFTLSSIKKNPLVKWTTLLEYSPDHCDDVYSWFITFILK